MQLHHKDFYLRELSRQDIPRVNAWRNDPQVVQGLGAPFRFVNLETDESWFEDYQRNRHCQVRLVIVSTKTQEPVGMVNLLAIDSVTRSAEFGLQIGCRTEWGKGLGTWAVQALLRHAFGNLNLHRVYLTVLANHSAAIRLYEKTGFKREGILRHAAFKDGEYRDLIVMSILRDEFSETDQPESREDRAFGPAAAR